MPSRCGTAAKQREKHEESSGCNSTTVLEDLPERVWRLGVGTRLLLRHAHRMTHVNQKTNGIQRGERRGCAVVAQTIGVLSGEDVMSRDGTQTFEGCMRRNVMRRSEQA